MGSKPEELVPVGIDLGSLHARVAIGNVIHATRSSAPPSSESSPPPLSAIFVEDVRVPLPGVISNAQGSRYTIALVGSDRQAGGDNDDNGQGTGEAAAVGHVFGEAALRALARDKKPTLSEDPSSLVRELVKRGSSIVCESDGDKPDAAAANTACAAFFEHLAELACDASSSRPAYLRAVVSVPIDSTPEEQAAIVRIAERGIGGVAAGEKAGGGKKKKKNQGKDAEANEEDSAIVGVITDPAAVCIAHGLAEAPRPEAVNLSAPTDANPPAAPWKTALVVDWGASGLTATRFIRAGSYQTALLSVTGHVSDPSCSGVVIVDALAVHCASMFERKHRLGAGEVLRSSVKARHRLEAACESAVRTLSRAPTTTVAVDGLYEGLDMAVSISRPRFEMLTGGILRTAEALLRKFALEPVGDGTESAFDVVLLAGNVCDMPSVSSLVRTKLFPSARSFGRADVPPDEAVAIGCARHAASVISCPTHSRAAAKETEPATRRVSTCPFSIGICRLHGKDRGDNQISEEEVEEIIAKDAVPLIEAGEPLPANITREVTCSGEDESSSSLSDCTIAIVQMGGSSGVKSKVLGMIDKIAPGAKNLEITLELTSAGELTLSMNGGPSCKL